MTPEQARTLARYNEWMNERLYGICAGLSDAERRRDAGAFFGSIHGTLNHLLLADRIWMARFRGETFAVDGLDAELYADFAGLRAAQAASDAALVDLVEGLDAARLAGVLEYTSILNPERRRYLVWLALTHWFNHQTHHRGQLTTLLSQCGADYGVTDLISLPNRPQPENPR